MIYIILGVIVIIIIYILVVRNGLVSLRNKVDEAFSTMDVYLKKRWDLIPNIVEIVKGYATHEKETFEEIAKLRSSAYDNMSTKNKLETNEKLNYDISKLMILKENYPELKSNENFLDLSHKLEKVEEDIANSRKYYNAVVRLYNNKVEMFPSNVIAGIFRFRNHQMFSINESDRECVDIKL